MLSAPNAASFGGCLWWAELLAAASFAGDSLLDCGDAPGRAVAALRLGLPGLVLSCEPAAFAAVAAIAGVTGAKLLAAAPPALDLGQRGAERRLAAWLADDSAAALR